MKSSSLPKVARVPLDPMKPLLGALVASLMVGCQDSDASRAEPDAGPAPRNSEVTATNEQSSDASPAPALAPTATQDAGPPSVPPTGDASAPFSAATDSGSTGLAELTDASNAARDSGIEHASDASTSSPSDARAALELDATLGTNDAAHEATPNDAAVTQGIESSEDCRACRAERCPNESANCDQGCQALSACYDDTGCAQLNEAGSDTTDCLCGALEALDCFSSGDTAPGSCASQIYANMEPDIMGASDALLNWTNTDYAIGRTNMLYYCESTQCAAECGWPSPRDQ
ncbi:MAG TPA: hypothetical protein VHM70_00530 [Polyangiaceae bacterium]|nr:hypothetical protein [Polyangiaceae bacterium]